MQIQIQDLLSSQQIDIKTIQGRFLQINQDRLSRTCSLLTLKQQEIMEILPALFQINHKDLPGFVDDTTPAGIYNYIPDDKVTLLVKNRWRGLELKRRGVWSFDIEAIFLMGSCGTIAFNKKSDFDIWLCHHPKLNEGQISKLKQKARKIENWCLNVGLEVHFFLMNAESFKRGELLNLSTESSGTAQHHLLLDEFYRTSIWLAGKTPFWWYVPPAQEKMYDEIRLAFISQDIISELEIVDFGGLPDIPTSEYFGAAVWQIYKGIESPYKSVLKITLMESYADSYPLNTPLSAEFKQRIYDDELDLDALDPYIMMLGRIEEHVRKQKEENRLDVIRQSFYLKLEMPLSSTLEKNNWRKRSVKALVNRWDWSSKKINYLDNKRSWLLEDVIDERKLLIMHLTQSYSFLSKFARKNAKERLINQKDLSILGRKLYSAFDRKPGKIEIFNRGNTDKITELNVTVMRLKGKDKRDHWHLYRGKVIGDAFKNKSALKQSFSLVELITWAHCNAVVTNETQKLLYAPGCEFGNKELNTLLAAIMNVLPDTKALTPHAKDLLDQSKVEISELYVNVGNQPRISDTWSEKQLMGAEVDILNFGTNMTCLVCSLEYMLVTSWKEVFVYKYYGIDGLAIWLCAALNQEKLSAKDTLNKKMSVKCFTSYISHDLIQRLDKLRASLIRHFLIVESQSLYIYLAGGKYFCIYLEGDKYSYKKLPNINALIQYLSASHAKFQSIYFDEFATSSNHISALYSVNKRNVVQVFFAQVKDNVLLYVLDEMGVLFFQKMPQTSVGDLLRHFVTFLTTIIDRRYLLQQCLMNEEVAFSNIEDELEIYKLEKERYNYVAKLQSLPEPEIDDNFSVKVVGDIVEKKTIFTFICDDAEFSTHEWGSDVFNQVAKHIVKKRENKQKYYVYITDLELSPAVLRKKTPGDVKMAELLRYKKKIEISLNSALKKI